MFIDSKTLRRHREVAHPTAGSDPDLDQEEDAEDTDEEIEPGKEELFDANSNIETINYEHPSSPQEAVNNQPPSPQDTAEYETPHSPQDREDVDPNMEEPTPALEDSGVSVRGDTSAEMDSSIDMNQSLDSSGISA